MIRFWWENSEGKKTTNTSGIVWRARTDVSVVIRIASCYYLVHARRTRLFRGILGKSFPTERGPPPPPPPPENTRRNNARRLICIHSYSLFCNFRDRKWKRLIITTTIITRVVRQFRFGDQYYHPFPPPFTVSEAQSSPPTRYTRRTTVSKPYAS